MRKIIIASSLLLSIICKEKSFAQLHGCFDNANGWFYTQQNFLGYYEAIGQRYRTVPPNCPRVQLGIRDGDCYFQLLGAAYPRYQYQLVTTTSSPVACDFDHYTMGAVALVGLFGWIKLRRKQI